MGCGSSQVGQPVHSYSLSGKNVIESSKLKGRITITEQGAVPIYFARDSALINQLNKEITYRLKEASAIPKNQETEFIDLRSQDEFNKSHIHLFMNFDANKEQALSSSEQTLKILFDFKHVFFLADSNDQRNLEPANSMIEFGSTSLNDQSVAQVTQQQTIRIPARVKSVIKLLNSKNVKAKTYNIIQSDYPSLESTYLNYIVKNFQAKKLENQQELQNQQQQQQQQQSNLVGENEIFEGTIFTQVQMPLFIYDHNDFIASNDKGIKVSSNKPCQIYLQSLPHFHSNIKTSEGKQFYTHSLKISAICITNQNISVQELSEIISIFSNVPAKHFILKDNKENKIQLMKQLYNNIEAGQNTLIIRDSNKENFLDVVQVFKGLMYEKYCVFSSQIQDYLSSIVPKNIAYQMHTTASMAVNVGERTHIQIEDIKQDKQEMNRCQQLTGLITPIFKANKKRKDKQDQFTDVFAQLFENIIRNPNEDKFRIIKKENKKIKEAVLNYKQSSQILVLCGFVDKGDIYQNQLTPADLTLIKGDFDLAIKNSLKDL